MHLLLIAPIPVTTTNAPMTAMATTPATTTYAESQSPSSTLTAGDQGERNTSHVKISVKKEKIIYSLGSDSLFVAMYLSLLLFREDQQYIALNYQYIAIVISYATFHC